MHFPKHHRVGESDRTKRHVQSSAGEILINYPRVRKHESARLAQSVEHQTFNLRVKGSSPLSGDFMFFLFRFLQFIKLKKSKNGKAL